MKNKFVGIFVCMLFLTSSTLIIGAVNFYEPTTPNIINLTNGVYWAGVEHTFFITSVDPEEQKIFYKIDWGDGTVTDWLGPYGSGEWVSFTHYWSETGNYYIKVVAKNEYGEESDWLTFRISVIPPNRLFKNMEIHGTLKTKPWRGLIISVMNFDIATVTKATLGNAQIGPFTCHNYKFIAVALNVQSYNKVTLDIECSTPIAIIADY